MNHLVPTEDLFHHLVSQAYEAALNPVHWKRYCIELIQHFGEKSLIDLQLWEHGATTVQTCQSEIDRPENVFFDELKSHIKRASEISRRLTEVNHIRDVSKEILNRLPYGVVLISKNATPLVINDAATGLIRDSDCLSLTLEGIVAINSELQEKLNQQICSLLENKANQQEFRILKCGETGRQLYLIISPIGKTGFDHLNNSQAVALLFIYQEQASVEYSRALLAELYAISPAENRVIAALLGGNCVEEAADKLYISKNTLRAHLRSIFRKTGVKSQADLIRFVLSGPLVLREVN